MRIWEELDYEHDAIIQASAGTGKTYALEHMVQHLVEAKGVDIRNLLLVTFTEKAAGELKERIRGMLSSAKSDSAQSALKHLDEATICTIHSFCQELLREYPFESGMQMMTEVVSSDKDVVEKAVRAVLTGPGFAAQEGDGFQEKIKEWKSGKDAESFCRACVEYVRAIVGSGKSPSEWRGDEIVRRFAGYRAVIDEIVREIQTGNGGEEPGAEVLRAVHFTNRQRRNRDQFMRLPALLGELSAVRCDVDNVKEDGARLLAELKALGVSFGLYDENGGKIFAEDGEQVKLSEKFPLYGKLKKTAVDALKIFDVTIIDTSGVMAYKEYLRLKKRSSSITFDDMVLETSRVVKDAVTDTGNAAKQAFLQKIRSRYRIALVDEFQDTDDKQWTIFDSLFSSRVNKLEGAHPAQGCLIVVGDPKQAIYAFRGADIDTYLGAKEKILKRTNRAEPYKLATMYRSTEEMVEAFNALFRNTADNSAGWFKDMQSNGLPIEYDDVNFPEEDEDPPEDVKNFKYPLRKDSQDSRERAVELLETIPEGMNEAKKNACLPLFLENMAAEMKYLHESKFWMTRPEPKDCMNWSAMCVLAKSHADCEAAQRVLRAKGIPCRQYKESGLFDSVESESVLALFDYLSMPRSAGNLAALLLTPLFEVPLAGIEKALETGAGEVEALCDKWRSYIATCEWVKFFESVMNETALGRPHPGDADHLRHRSGVRQIFDQLLERHGRARELSAMTDALRHWRRDDGDAGEEGAVRNKESESDAVQIMTMHASKGLEFNAVFLPYGYGAMLGPQTQKEERPAALLEVKRLLYVALTRAKYKLYLPWSKRMTDDSFARGSALGSVLGAGIRKLYAEQYNRNPNDCVLGVDAVPQKTETGTAGNGCAESAETARKCPELPPSRGMKGWRFKWDSFSSMNHHAARKEDVVVEGVRIVDDEAPDEGERPESLVPKGASSGTVFHEVMEILCNNDAGKGEVDFSIGQKEFAEVIRETEDVKSPLLEIVRRRMHANGVVNRAGKTDGESTAVSIARMAWNALRTELDVDGDKFKLCTIERKNRKAEVNFVLDERDVVGKDSKREGALNGSIDLIVRRADNRYCIIDWKTNTLEGYDAASVQTAMNEAGYHLQYRLYSYAAEKWLGGAVVKGATYLFVRGGEFTPGDLSGVFQYDKWAEERAGFAAELADRLADCDKSEEQAEGEDQ